MLPQRAGNSLVQLEFSKTFGKAAGHMFRKTNRAQIQGWYTMLRIHHAKIHSASCKESLILSKKGDMFWITILERSDERWHEKLGQRKVVRILS